MPGITASKLLYFHQFFIQYSPETSCAKIEVLHVIDNIIAKILGKSFGNAAQINIMLWHLEQLDIKPK